MPPTSRASARKQPELSALGTTGIDALARKDAAVADFTPVFAHQEPGFEGLSYDPDDIELARQGLSRGVLALRSGLVM